MLLRCCGLLVRSMGRAEADAALQGDLMPALVKAFQHSSADVRKAASAPHTPATSLRASFLLSHTGLPTNIGGAVFFGMAWHCHDMTCCRIVR